MNHPDPNSISAVVAGVGASSGLGAALARRFAREGLRVYILGRTFDKLATVTADIQKAGGQVQAIATDCTQPFEIKGVFEKIREDGGRLGLAAYNVGNNAMVPFLEIAPDFFETLWRQNAYGGFLFGQEALRQMLPYGEGSILFTGATASLRARPPFTAFASAKAALRAIAQGMAREFGPQGIHVAHIVIDGVINGDYVQKNFPEFAATRGADGLLNPDDIASAFWDLHCQPRSAWTHELDLRPYKENF